MTNRRGCLSKLLLLIVLIGVAAALVPLLPISPLKSAVEQKLSNALGRKVAVESVRLSLITGPYLTLTGMTVRRIWLVRFISQAGRRGSTSVSHFVEVKLFLIP